MGTRKGLLFFKCLMETSTRNLISSQGELCISSSVYSCNEWKKRTEGCVVALAEVAGWMIRGISYSVTDHARYSQLWTDRVKQKTWPSTFVTANFPSSPKSSPQMEDVLPYTWNISHYPDVNDIVKKWSFLWNLLWHTNFLHKQLPEEIGLFQKSTSSWCQHLNVIKQKNAAK